MPAKLASVPDAIPFADQVSSLNPIGDAIDGTVARSSGAWVERIPLDKIHPHPANGRRRLGNLEELAASIKEAGLVQTPVLCPHPTRAGHYYANIGNRRLAALRLNGVRFLDGWVRQDFIGDAKQRQISLIENWHRQDFDPMEKAQQMGLMRDVDGLKNRQIARKIGVHESTVSTYLLLEVSPSVQSKVEAGEVSMSRAVEMARKARARTAKATGHADRREAMALTWEPDHFDRTHHLAARASDLCDTRGHNNRRRLGRGKVACGECFEDEVRRDQEIVTTMRLVSEIEESFPADDTIAEVLGFLRARLPGKRGRTQATVARAATA